MQGVHGGDIYRNTVTLDFSVNVNPFGMPEDAKKALYRAVDLGGIYPDIAAEELTHAVGKRLGIEGERLVFGSGASELFMAVAHAVKPKRTVIPIPSFFGYEYAAEAVDSEIVYVELKETEAFLPGQNLMDALTEQTDLLFLANPNNPTGKLLKRGYLREVLKHCRESNICVVLDECFIEFCGADASFLSEAKEYPNLIIVRAFTKSYALPGVRLGYLIGSDVALLQVIRKQLPEWNLSVFAQKAGVACAEAKSYMEETVHYIESERNYMEEKLCESGLTVFHGEANFLLVYSEKPLYELLLSQGILIRDCSNFKGLSKGYYRIAVKRREENERLWKAIGECVEQD